MSSRNTSQHPAVVTRGYSLWARLGEDGAASFDAAGRLLTARLGDRFIRRGLDGTVIELRRDAASPWPWTAQRLASTDDLLDTVGHHLERAGRAPLPTGARPRLERALAGLADGYQADRRAFTATLGSVPIVPSNHARCVYVRLTEGCQYDACTFCSLYSGTPFRTRPLDEFRRHVQAVLAYFGDGAGVRPSIWVGDASALEATAAGFAAALDVLHEEIRIAPAGGDGHLFKGGDPRLFEGIYAFADVPRAARLDPDEVVALARRGVRRLYLGVESGHDPLLRRLRKPHAREQVVEAVRRLRAGGIASGVILMVGAGGREMAAPHRAASAALIAELDLGRDDFVFLSPLDETSRSPGPVAGDDPLTEHELAAEVRAVRTALRQANGPYLRIADYQLDSFVY